MRILIISDTHGRHKGVDKIWDEVGAVDMLIHLGDVEGGEEYLNAVFDCPKHIIQGNNDFFSDLPEEEEFQLGPYKVLITHGHNYYVSVGLERLVQRAHAAGADIVMFGHTHRPYLARKSDIIFLNPGSVTYPRQEGRKGSYILMELDDKKGLTIDQRYL